jgi:ribosomal protein S27AE
MQTLLLLDQAAILLRRRDESSGSGMGCFVVLLIVGIVAFLIMRGRRDREEQLGTAHRPMGTGPVEGFTFANPYAKCPTCGAAGDKMKQQYDGLRKVTWTCGYCGSTAGIQELKDEELPPGARQRLGLDMPQGMPGQQGYYPPQQGGGMGVGGILTGMMIGNMLGGGHHDRDRDGWGDGGGSSSGGDWGDGGGASSGGDWGDSGGGDSGGDWGDSGGGDSGGSDF